MPFAAQTERFGPSNVLAGRFRPAPKLSHPPIRLAYPEDVFQPTGPRRIDVAMDTVTSLGLAFERRLELLLESLPVLVVVAGLGGSAQVRQVRADRHGDPLQPMVHPVQHAYHRFWLCYCHRQRPRVFGFSPQLADLSPLLRWVQPGPRPGPLPEQRTAAIAAALGPPRDILPLEGADFRVGLAAVRPEGPPGEALDHPADAVDLGLQPLDCGGHAPQALEALTGVGVHLRSESTRGVEVQGWGLRRTPLPDKGRDGREQQLKQVFQEFAD